jgi:hypothetical protein
MAQSKIIADNLKKEGIALDSHKEMIAIIAYL